MPLHVLIALATAGTLAAMADAPPSSQASPSSLLFTLPAPTGPFAVGTTRWVATDRVRRETFDAGRSARQVTVVAWYPTETRIGTIAPYFREGLIEIRSFARLLGQPADTFDSMAGVRTHGIVNAPPAAEPARLPMLIFSHGYTASASAYTALIEDLASRGYVVLSINHPYESTGATLDDREVSLLDERGVLRQPIRDVFAEWTTEDVVMGEVIKLPGEEAQRQRLRAYLLTLTRTTAMVDRWVADTRLVVDSLDQLDRSTPAGRVAARLDISRFGAFGHSNGGVTSGEFCLVERRCVAAANLDGIPQYGRMIDSKLDRPFMMVYSGRPTRLGASDSIYRPAASRYYRVDVAGTLHLDFSDMPFWQPFRQRNALGPIDPDRITMITRALIAEFFDQELRGQPSSLLSGQRPLPGVTVHPTR